MNKTYDVIVIGSGAAGIMASITASKNGNKVLLLEALSQLSSKLKATGGGRCNLTNTLSIDEFMQRFGKNGRFMSDALNSLNHTELRDFFLKIGVETHAPDGYRVFPITHSSQTIINALTQEMQNNDVEVQCLQKVTDITIDENNIKTVFTNTHDFQSKNIVIATGGLGYAKLGASGDGYNFAKKFGHKINKLYPAMMPLDTKDEWVSLCRADTIAKVEMYVNIKKYNKIKAKGDLIFTKNGIRGPVVLDFAREITPLFDMYHEIPLIMNLIKGLNEDDVIQLFKNNPTQNIQEVLLQILPLSIIIELSKLVNVDSTLKYKNLDGKLKVEFLKILVKTPLTISGHDGFKLAMITRGGINLKEINPSTMQSKIQKGIYFCGEVIDIDGPCGGYNLQWSFSSGYLAGKLL